MVYENMKMPDESCRKCGELLTEYSICAKCRISNQLICKRCKMITLQQHHSLCFYDVNPIEGLLVIGA